MLLILCIAAVVVICGVTFAAVVLAGRYDRD